MKKINQYIIEKFKINSKSVANSNSDSKGLNIEEFRDELQELFDLKNDEIDKLMNSLINDWKINKFTFKYIENTNEYKDIYDIASDMKDNPKGVSITYPGTYKYQNFILDLVVYKYKHRDNKQYLFFIDNKINKFYIYLIK